MIAAVVGDALVDILIGAIDGPLKKWFRRHRIGQVQSMYGNVFAKMIGCLLGTGLVLTITWAVGISPWNVLRAAPSAA